MTYFYRYGYNNFPFIFFPKLMINLVRLRLLHELSILGSISAVADAVHLTRPAVSKQLALLQDELDVVLLEKSGRGVQLTSAGRRIASRAAQLIKLMEGMEEELANERREVSGEIRLTAFGSVATNLVPQALEILAEKHPALTVFVTELEPAEGLKAAASRQADLAVVDDLVSAESFSGTLEFHPLCVDQIDAVVPATHKLAGRKSIQLSDLAHDTWTSPQHSAATYLSFFRNACLAAGFVPKVTSFGSLSLMLAMIRTAHSVAVLPRLSLLRAKEDPLLRVIPVEPTINRRIFVAMPSAGAKRPAVSAVMDALLQSARYLDELQTDNEVAN